VCEYNSSLWNSGIEANKEIARKQKRRLVYMSNILVIKDPANPQNEGELKLFKYGKKIFDKINDQMNPQFEDENPTNPFDLWEGANFRLKIRKVDGFNNFDKSEFDSVSPLYEGADEKLEELWKKEFPLSEFTDDSRFKEFSELKSRLDRVLGAQSEPVVPVSEPPFDGGKPMTTPHEPPVVESVTTPTTAENENDESLTYFQKLAEDAA
jgi:hypothetical protein